MKSVRDKVSSSVNIRRGMIGMNKGFIVYDQVNIFVANQAADKVSDIVYTITNFDDIFMTIALGLNKK